MDDEAAFLRAILADTADDVVRLAYADWLDEHDRREYAEFIRVQVNGGSVRRIEDLWTGQDYDVYAEKDVCGVVVNSMPDPFRWMVLPAHLDKNLVGDLQAVVRRGFVDEVRLPMAAFAGRICDRCDGGYVRETSDYIIADGECRACNGSSRVPGLAKDIFSRHPVTLVSFPEADLQIRIGKYGTVRKWQARIFRGKNELPEDFIDSDSRENLLENLLELFRTVYH